MTSRLNPYIGFDGNAREALEFHRDVSGGGLTMHTCGESGDPEGPQAQQIMHGMLRSGLGFTLTAADSPPDMPYNPGDNIAISLSGDDVGTLRGYGARLSDGGTVSVPLEMQMRGDEFGQCTGRFDISWMVDISGSSAGQG